MYRERDICMCVFRVLSSALGGDQSQRTLVPPALGMRQHSPHTAVVLRGEHQRRQAEGVLRNGRFLNGW